MAKYKSIFPVLLDIDKDSIPIFIPTFNQPSLLRLTLEQVAGRQNRVIVYDNNSAYDAMKDYLVEISSDVDVVFSEQNSGPRIFTEDKQILSLMPDYFVVTDPDLIHSNDLPDNHIDEMRRIINQHSLAKAGFALEIHDPEETERFLDLSKVNEWELPYWREEIGLTRTGDKIYGAWIDTTYSLNKREACLYHRGFNKPTFRYPSARIAGKYTCRHIGWWRKDLMPQDKSEIDFYLNNQVWSHTENHYYSGVSG